MSRAVGSRKPEADGRVYRCRRQHGDAKLGLGPPQNGRIWGMTVRFSAIISTISIGLAAGACSMPDMDSFRAPDAAALFSARSVSNYRDKVLPPVAAADLVDANGNCAGAYAPPAASGDQSVQSNVPLSAAGIPPVPAAIALEMTECDVVKRAGVAERA